MGTQTGKFKRKVLEGAAATGYAGLYWYIEMSLPGRVFASAAHPGKWVPVIPVAPDPEVTRHWAHMLAEMFKDSNPPTITFEPALTALDVMQSTGLPWYVYGDPVLVDVVCRACGAIEQIDAHLLQHSPAWVCEFCS